jgi:transposase
MMPHDLPPWPLVYQQMRRWMAAGCFAAIMHDLRILLRRAADRPAPPSAAMLDALTLPSTAESGARAGDDGHQRRKGSKVHAAVDTLGHLLALLVTPANAQERAQVAELATAVQAVTGDHVERASVDCRSGLYWRRARRGGRRAGHPVGGRQAARGQARLRAPAPQVGRGARFRVGSPLPPLGARL